MITPEQFAKLFPRLSEQKRAAYLPAILAALARFEINTPLRIAGFCSQIGHESKGLTDWEEDLSYRAQRLTEVWPRRFPTLASAQPYAGNPEKLANKVYASRMGNGDEASGDGWRYRGRGPKQLTGLDNYRAFSVATGVDAVANPDILLEPESGFLAAAWFWDSNNLNPVADAQDMRRMTRIINGGLNGLEERSRLFRQAKQILGVRP